jgi:hypothetical protein
VRPARQAGADRELKWIERMRDSRALRITAAGRRGLMEHVALSLQHRDGRACPATHVSSPTRRKKDADARIRAWALR